MFADAGPTSELCMQAGTDSCDKTAISSQTDARVAATTQQPWWVQPLFIGFTET